MLSSCGEYQKLLKSNDYNLKYTKALEYFRDKEYTRSLRILDEIGAVYSGTNRAQLIAYHKAYCNFYLKDYNKASNLFKDLVISYPGSSLIEESLYMAAYAEYLDSPRPLLDQAPTKLALEDFQFFIDRYGNSSRKENVNKYMDEMYDKLSYKGYLSAKNYYIRGKYKSAIIYFENCLKDYPGSKYREDVIYMLFKSKYKLAINSVDEKKLDRYNAAKEEYYYFIEDYPNSKYKKEMDRNYAAVDDYLKNYDFRINTDPDNNTKKNQ